MSTELLSCCAICAGLLQYDIHQDAISRCCRIQMKSRRIDIISCGAIMSSCFAALCMADIVILLEICFLPLDLAYLRYISTILLRQGDVLQGVTGVVVPLISGTIVSFSRNH